MPSKVTVLFVANRQIDGGDYTRRYSDVKVLGQKE